MSRMATSSFNARAVHAVLKLDLMQHRYKMHQDVFVQSAVAGMSSTLSALFMRWRSQVGRSHFTSNLNRFILKMASKCFGVFASFLYCVQAMPQRNAVFCLLRSSKLRQQITATISERQ